MVRFPSSFLTNGSYSRFAESKVEEVKSKVEAAQKQRIAAEAQLEEQLATQDSRDGAENGALYALILRILTPAEAQMTPRHACLRYERWLKRQSVKSYSS